MHDLDSLLSQKLKITDFEMAWKLIEPMIPIAVHWVDTMDDFDLDKPLLWVDVENDIVISGCIE